MGMGPLTPGWGGQWRQSAKTLSTPRASGFRGRWRCGEGGVPRRGGELHALTPATPCPGHPPLWLFLTVSFIINDTVNEALP